LRSQIDSLEKRFNKHIRTYLATLTLVIYIFTKISVTIYAGAILIDVVLGWNIWIAAVLIMVSTGIYTIFGGLSAVIYTEVLQTIVLLIGAVILAILAFIQVGGLTNFMNEKPQSFHLVCYMNISSYYSLNLLQIKSFLGPVLCLVCRLLVYGTGAAIK
jgi:Na+/proline symporter